MHFLIFRHVVFLNAASAYRSMCTPQEPFNSLHGNLFLQQKCRRTAKTGCPAALLTAG
ncbi:hypothetical protein CLOSTHATH_01729 [Hungatella hathewayi DSM 13479]|uniref:Uncharacterized protein n=1 Tax=Hungatella hathewayi DSM 13479 TaxID=566550 RepID=D3ADQ1_9FIRM|nr:hypothetical protein CLOSTHATH_01729 [Hungatella hathewayi DSM 13479]